MQKNFIRILLLVNGLLCVGAIYYYYSRPRMRHIGERILRIEEILKLKIQITDDVENIDDFLLYVKLMGVGYEIEYNKKHTELVIQKGEMTYEQFLMKYAEQTHSDVCMINGKINIKPK